MKLNCDIGESFGSWSMGADAEIMPYIDMANIACGFHASDPQHMSDTVALAHKHNVVIGAHPSYPDLLGFGRKDMVFSASEIINMVLYQVGALQAICSSHGTAVSYVKPHGALYNLMMRDTQTYITLLRAMSSLDMKIPLMIMSNHRREEFIQLAKKFDVELIFEAFCDRSYTDEGSLQSRNIKGAVYSDIEKIKKQALKLIKENSVISSSGKEIPIVAQSICVHGDSDFAVNAVKQVRKILTVL